MTMLPASLPTVPEYDRQARANYWHPEALFGLVYEHVHPGDTLLDVGIGTGLASVPFVKALTITHMFTRHTGGQRSMVN